MRSAFRLGFVVLGACAYTGLAILGWGGFRPFFSHPALTALAAVLFALSILSFFAGGNLNAGVREDRGNRWVIAVFVIIGFLNAYLPAYTVRCRALRRGWRIADLASVCARPSIQRLGRDSTRTQSGNQRHLRGYPSPQLSWPAH